VNLALSNSTRGFHASIQHWETQLKSHNNRFLFLEAKTGRLLSQHLPLIPQKNIFIKGYHFLAPSWGLFPASSQVMTPSPPPASSGELISHGLHHLVMHNSSAIYPHEQQYDEEIQLQSGYASPPPREDPYTYRNEQPRYMYQHQHQDSGLGIQYVRNVFLIAKASLT
jgi:hypothetical protein